MSLEGLFINGVYRGVLSDIAAVQSLVPNQVLYLQPYAGSRIAELASKPPSIESPVRLFCSLTDDLPTVRYTCEIIGWHDKRELVGRQHEIIEAVIRAFQLTEDGIYHHINNTECVNLLSVRNMRELSKPFSVSELEKLSDNQPLSLNRSRSGGWSYVRYPTDDWLAPHF